MREARGPALEYSPAVLAPLLQLLLDEQRFANMTEAFLRRRLLQSFFGSLAAIIKQLINQTDAPLASVLLIGWQAVGLNRKKGCDMSIKSFLTVSAVAVAALVAPAAQALFQGQATFQGVTFIFTQTDSNTLQFELKGTTPLGGDWATAQFFGAFDLKDLGITNFTAVANGPGATNLAGLNSQLSAANPDCSGMGSPPGGICFDISPDIALGASFDFIYTIDFSKDLDIAETGPHLQVVFTATENGPKVGSLYSQNVPSSSGPSSSGPSSSGPSSSGPNLPEPGTLALLGAALASLAVLRRRGGHKV